MFISLSLDSAEFQAELKKASKEAERAGALFGKNLGRAITENVKRRLTAIAGIYSRFISDPLKAIRSSVSFLASLIGEGIPRAIRAGIRLLPSIYDRFIYQPFQAIRARILQTQLGRELAEKISTGLRTLSDIYNRRILFPLILLRTRVADVATFIGASIILGIASQLPAIAAAYNRFILAPLTALASSIANTATFVGASILLGIARSLPPIATAFNRYILAPLRAIAASVATTAQFIGASILLGIASQLPAIGAVFSAIRSELAALGFAFNALILQPLRIVVTEVIAQMRLLASAVAGVLKTVPALYTKYILTPLTRLGLKLRAVGTQLAFSLTRAFSFGLGALRGIYTSLIAPLIAISKTVGTAIGRTLSTRVLTPLSTLGRSMSSLFGRAYIRLVAVTKRSAKIIGTSLVNGLLTTMLGINRVTFIFTSTFARIVTIATRFGRLIGRALLRGITIGVAGLSALLNGVILPAANQAATIALAAGRRIGSALKAGIRLGLAGLGTIISTVVGTAAGRASVIAGAAGTAAGNAFKFALKAALVGGVVFGLLGFSGVKLAADLEQIVIAYDTILSSQETAVTSGQLVNELFDFAARTPFGFEELSRSTKSLLAFGEPAEDVVETLRRIGDVAAGVGAPITELATIYGKARVQGRAFARDMNELTNRGIPIFDLLSDQLGVSTDRIKEMVSEGLIGFEHIEQAFVTMTSEGGTFFDLMSKLSQTVGGLWTTFADNVKFALRSLGTVLIDVFDIKELLAEGIAGLQVLSLFLSRYVQKVERGVTPITAFRNSLRTAFGDEAVERFERLIPYIERVGDVITILRESVGKVATAFGRFSGEGIEGVIRGVLEQFNISPDAQAPILLFFMKVSDLMVAARDAVSAVGASIFDSLGESPDISSEIFNALEHLISLFEWITDNKVAVASAVKAIAGAFAALAVIGKLTALFNPATAALLAILGIVGFIAFAIEKNLLGLGDVFEKVSDFITIFAGNIGDGMSPLDALSDAVERAFGEDALARVQPFLNFLEDVKLTVMAFAEGGFDAGLSMFFEQFAVPPETQAQILLFISHVQSALQWLEDHRDGVVAALTAMAVAFGALTVIAAIAGLISGIPLALAAVQLAIGAFAFAWEENLWGMRDTLTEWWNSWIKPALSAFGNYVVETMIPTLDGLQQQFWTIWKLIGQAVITWWEEDVKPALEAFKLWLDTDFADAVTVATDNFTLLWEAAGVAFEDLMVRLQPTFDALELFFDTTLPDAYDDAKQSLIDWKDSALQTFRDFIGGILEVKNEIDGFLQKIGEVVGLRTPDVVLPFGGSPANNYKGTDNFKGGLSWVGERGAELMDLPRGTRIFNHTESLRLAAGAFSGMGNRGNTQKIFNTTHLSRTLNNIATTHNTTSTVDSSTTLQSGAVAITVVAKDVLESDNLTDFIKKSYGG